jgi:hypothetical protein
MPHAGMRYIETLRLALSAIPGARAGLVYRYEPVYVFGNPDI